MATRGIYVGIDVSKAKLDVYFEGSKSSFQVTNDDTGFARLIQQLSTVGSVELVVFESTGQYHTRLHTALIDAGIHAHVANPRRVKAFAIARGHMAKTDALDAKLLCAFAAFVEVPTQNENVGQFKQLSALMHRRQQIQKHCVAERLRRMHADECVRSSINAVIDVLKKQEKELSKLIHAEMVAHSNRRMQILVSVPGVGPMVASSLICWCPEIGYENSKKLAGLVGVAPYASDSGQWHGKRKARGGRRQVRTALYLAALVGVRFNPVLRTFYDRLLKAGKVKKLALLAVARKLLCILNAMLKADKEWDPNRADCSSVCLAA
jgi:transposase